MLISHTEYFVDAEAGGLAIVRLADNDTEEGGIPPLELSVRVTIHVTEKAREEGMGVDPADAFKFRIGRGEFGLLAQP